MKVCPKCETYDVKFHDCERNIREREEKLASSACSDSSSWPMADVLAKLCEAADILLDQKDYDGHGHELIEGARREAREYLNQNSQDRER